MYIQNTHLICTYIHNVHTEYSSYIHNVHIEYSSYIHIYTQCTYRILILYTHIYTMYIYHDYLYISLFICMSIFFLSLSLSLQFLSLYFFLTQCDSLSLYLSHSLTSARCFSTPSPYLSHYIPLSLPILIKETDITFLPMTVVYTL